MSSLPNNYLSPVDLPFNHSSLTGRFQIGCHASPVAAVERWLLVQGNFLLLPEGGLDLPECLPAEAEIVTGIGTFDDRPLGLARLSRQADIPPGWQGHRLDSQQPDLDISLLSLAALGRQILYWQRQSRFCSRCGESCAPLPQDWGKACGGCGALHYPHIHPCIIVLVRRGEELLLTRQAEWNPGRYSLVAGFVDFGECLEEAVVREVQEETGIEVRNIRYVGSQSWPFPSQIMTGFIADYAGGDVRIQEEELEDARWFHRDRLPNLPPKRSIARYILDGSLEGRF